MIFAVINGVVFYEVTVADAGIAICIEVSDEFREIITAEIRRIEVRKKADRENLKMSPFEKKRRRALFLYTLTIRFVQNRPCLPDVYPPKRLGRKGLRVFREGRRLPFRLPIFSRRSPKHLPLLRKFLKFPKMYGGTILILYQRGKN